MAKQRSRLVTSAAATVAAVSQGVESVILDSMCVCLLCQPSFGHYCLAVSTLVAAACSSAGAARRYKALAVALRIGPAQLGSLTTARGVVQSVLSLFVGALGDRYHRGRIITAGAACQRCKLAVVQLVL
jgi:MFS family permease